MNTVVIETIQSLAKQFHADTVAIRQHLHQYPELSFQEVQTGTYIAQQLDKLGIPYIHGWVKHGITAVIEGKKTPSEKVIALRADMDALPILEESSQPYCSKNKGIMHACGHDVHTASLLGTARILKATAHLWSGKILLIFQPGEEKTPGGASLMLAEGALNPIPELIFGQHVHPQLPAGKVGFCPGVFMASCDEIYITIRGKGGHGAMPDQNIDPVLISGHVLVALQSIVSRNADPNTPSVLSFGKINSTGGATNVIPDEVKLEGTFRTFDEKWREKALKQIEQIVQMTCQAHGGNAIVHIERGYPFLNNDVVLTQKSMNWAKEFLGNEQVVQLPKRMTSEDFAYYSQLYPACFYRLGTANTKKGITSSVHTSTFDIDESALQTSIGLMAYLAIMAFQA